MKNKQQAVKTFYNVMNFLVMSEEHRGLQLPNWFTDLSTRIQNKQLVEDELTDLYYQLDQQLTRAFGSKISKDLIPNRFMA